MASSPVGQSANDSLVFGLERERQIGYASAALVIVGAFLPWASVLGMSVLGIDGDGVFTLILGAAVPVGIYARGWDQTVMLGTAAAGGLSVLIPAISMSQFSSIGVYVTILGGIGLLIAGQSGYRRIN